MSPTLQIGHQHHILAYSYVGDRLECHQHAEKCYQHPFFCHQHPKMVSNIKSPTSRCHQHHCHPQLSLSGVFQNFANVQHQIVFYGIVFVCIYGINLYSMLSVIPILWLKSD